MAGYSVTFSVVDNATKQINAINKQIAQMRKPMDDLSKASAKFIDVSGLGKVTQGLRGVASAAGQAFSSMARLVGVFGTLGGAASIAGIAALTKNFLDLGTQLERDADLIGSTTAKLQDMQNAVIAAGGAVDDMTNALKEVSKTTYDAVIGANNVAAVSYQRLGIALRDQNGHLREAADILPEALKALDQYTNAQERAQIANRLGGQALYELDEDFRRSGKTYDQWVAAARRYGVILDPKELQEYRQAVGGLNLAFRGLGTELSGVIAEALSPFIKDFAEWVHTHQPQIKAKVKELADAFEQWADNGGIQRVSEDLSKLLTIVEKLVTAMEWMAAHPAITGAVLGGVIGGRAGGLRGAAAGAVVGGTTGAFLGEEEPKPPVPQPGGGLPVIQPGPVNAPSIVPVINPFDFLLRWLMGGNKPPHAQHGGIVPINAHAGEMVLPKPISDGLQGLFMGGGYGTFATGSSNGPFSRMSEALLGWLRGGTGYRPLVELSPESILALSGAGKAGIGGQTTQGAGGAGGGGMPAPGGSVPAPAPATGPGQPVPGSVSAPAGQPGSAMERALPSTGIPATAEQLIKGAEGLSLTKYDDVGHPAIGYGHDITPQEMSQGFIRGATGNIPIAGGKITKEQAESIFQQDYQTRVAQITKMAPGFEKLNANQQGAVTSYYYNTGRLPRGFKENLAAGNMGAISESLRTGIATARGQYVPALGKRRADEARLFNQPVAEPPAPGAQPQTAGVPGVPGAVPPPATPGAAVGGIAGNERGLVSDPQHKVAPGMKQINANVIQWLNTALASMPGYHAEVAVGPEGHTTGTYTGGALSQVKLGQAADIRLIGPDGKPLPHMVAHNAQEDAAIRASPEFQVFKQLGDAYIKASGGQGRWGGNYSLADTMQYGTVSPGYPAGARADPRLYAAARAQGPNQTVARNAMPNGSVNVNITHKNPPAGTMVTANASGNGINLGDPRVEQQGFGQP